MQRLWAGVAALALVACDTSIFHALPAIEPPDPANPPPVENPCKAENAPSDLTVDVEGQRTLHLRWTDHSDGALTFTIQRSEDGSSFGDVASGVDDVEFVEDRGLDTVVSYQVKGAGDGCETAATAPATRTTAPAALVLAAGSHLGFLDADAGTDVASVHFVVDASGVKTASDGFHLERSVEGGPFVELRTIPASAFMPIDDNEVALDSHVAYRFVGDGPDVDAGAPFVVESDTPPKPVTNVTAVRRGLDIVVTWDNPNVLNLDDVDITVLDDQPPDNEEGVADGVNEYVVGRRGPGEDFSVTIIARNPGALSSDVGVARKERLFDSPGFCDDPLLAQFAVGFAGPDESRFGPFNSQGRAIVAEIDDLGDGVAGLLGHSYRFVVGADTLQGQPGEGALTFAPVPPTIAADSVVDVTLRSVGTNGCADIDRVIEDVRTDALPIVVTQTTFDVDNIVFDVVNPNTLAVDLDVRAVGGDGVNAIDVTVPLTTPVTTIPNAPADGLYSLTVSATPPGGRPTRTYRNALTVRPPPTVTSVVLEIPDVDAPPTGYRVAPLFNQGPGDPPVRVRVRRRADVNGAGRVINLENGVFPVRVFPFIDPNDQSDPPLDPAPNPLSLSEPLTFLFDSPAQFGVGVFSSAVRVDPNFAPAQSVPTANIASNCDLTLNATPVSDGPLDADTTLFFDDDEFAGAATTATTTLRPETALLEGLWRVVDSRGVIGERAFDVSAAWSGPHRDRGSTSLVPGGVVLAGRQPLEAADFGDCGNGCGGARAVLSVGGNGLKFTRGGTGHLVAATNISGVSDVPAFVSQSFGGANDAEGCRVDDAGVLACTGAIAADFGVVNDAVAVVGAANARACYLDDGGDVRCGGTSNDEDHFAGVVHGGVIVTAVRSLAMSFTHTCVVRNDDSVVCWGDSALLGVGGTPQTVTFPDGVRQIAVADDLTCAALNDGRVACLGKNNLTQIGDPSFGNDTPIARIVPGLGGELRFNGGGPPASSVPVVAVAVGNDHGCALDEAGFVFCWGRLSATGTGAINDSAGQVVTTAVTNLPGVVAVAAADGYSCAAAFDGQLFCWGRTSSKSAMHALHNPSQGGPVCANADVGVSLCVPVFSDVRGCGTLSATVKP